MSIGQFVYFMQTGRVGDFGDEGWSGRHKFYTPFLER